MAAGGIESEIKLRIEDAASARSALARLGAHITEPRHLEDNVMFDDPARSLAARGSMLRLRKTDHGSFVTFKGPRRIVDGIKVREEHETGVADPEAFRRVLLGMGLEPTFRYQKYREAWSWNDAEILVDETPIGSFLEIEGRSADIQAAAAALGRAPNDFIVDSYAALFFAAGGSGDMTFP